MTQSRRAAPRASSASARPIPLELDIVGRGMAQWRRERPDIDCSGKAVVGRILRLQDVILRAVDAALKLHGLRYPPYAVLATLRASGPPFRMSPSLLKDTLLLSSGGTSNLLARLEKKGWIRRFSDALDKRAVVVELTPAGRALADRAMVDHAQVERDLVGMFSPEQETELAAMLSRMLVVNSGAANWIPKVLSERGEPGRPADPGKRAPGMT